MSVVAKQAAAVQQSLEVERIRQHPGQQQVSRAVKVSVPGKHFPQLEAAEQKIDYDGTAVEYAERHKLRLWPRRPHDRPKGKVISYAAMHATSHALNRTANHQLCAREPGVQARAEEGETRWAGAPLLHEERERRAQPQHGPWQESHPEGHQKETQQEARRDADTADPPAVLTSPPPIVSVPGTVGCPPQDAARTRDHDLRRDHGLYLIRTGSRLRTTMCHGYGPPELNWKYRPEPTRTRSD